MMELEYILREAKGFTDIDYDKVLRNQFEIYKQTQFHAIKEIYDIEIKETFLNMKRQGYSEECIRYYVREYLSIKIPEYKYNKDG